MGNLIQYNMRVLFVFNVEFSESSIPHQELAYSPLGGIPPQIGNLWLRGWERSGLGTVFGNNEPQIQIQHLQETPLNICQLATVIVRSTEVSDFRWPSPKVTDLCWPHNSQWPLVSDLCC